MSSTSKPLKLSVGEVSPEQARVWLGSETPIVRAQQKYTRAYAREMKAGRWVLNGETVILSTSGKLLDGRKRLRACLDSGSPFPCIVVQDVDESEFKSIDALRARSPSDILYIRQEEYHRVLYYVLNLITRYYRHFARSIPAEASVSTRDVLHILDSRPEVRESVVKTAGFTRWGKHTVAAVGHHLASRVDPIRADAFFERVLHGHDAEGDSATLLRKAYQGSRGSSQDRMLALTVRAWNAEVQNRPLKYLRWRQEGTSPEAFPLIAGLRPDDGIDLDNERALDPAVRVNPNDVHATVELITPQVAERLFNGREPNRKVVTRVVEKYARDMQSGQWGLNGQTIKISKTGRLLDGQHRCAAAVKTGKPFSAIVVRGLPDEVFDTLDSGMPRSLGEVLASRGEKSTCSLAATLQKYWLYEHEMPTLHTLRGSHAELLGVLSRHPELRRSVQFCLNRLRDVIPGAIGAATHYLASQVDVSMADRFATSLGDGIELKRFSPILQLRELMRRNRANKKAPLTEVEKWALTIKALNAFFEDRQIRLLVWRHNINEAFPRILDRTRFLKRSPEAAMSNSNPLKT